MLIEFCVNRMVYGFNGLGLVFTNVLKSSVGCNSFLGIGHSLCDRQNMY